jgi:hypothetical protein
VESVRIFREIGISGLGPKVRQGAWSRPMQCELPNVTRYWLDSLSFAKQRKLGLFRLAAIELRLEIPWLLG